MVSRKVLALLSINYIVILVLFVLATIMHTSRGGYLPLEIGIPVVIVNGVLMVALVAHINKYSRLKEARQKEDMKLQQKDESKMFDDFLYDR